MGNLGTLQRKIAIVGMPYGEVYYAVPHAFMIQLQVNEPIASVTSHCMDTRTNSERKTHDDKQERHETARDYTAIPFSSKKKKEEDLAFEVFT